MLRSISDISGSQNIPFSPSANSLLLDEDTSDTSTKIENFSPVYFRDSNDSTPNFSGTSDLKSKLTSAKTLGIESISRDCEVLNQALQETESKRWEKAQNTLRSIQNPQLRDLAHSEAAKTAANMAAKEIQKAYPEISWSPTTLKAYAFCNQILHSATRQDTLRYIENTIPEENDEITGPVTAEMDTLLADFTFWDLAEKAALDKNWSKARTYLYKIQDDLWRDAACSNITKIAANEAIEAHGTPSYNSAVLNANSFCQDIVNEEFQRNTGMILRAMLDHKVKAPLGERLAGFGNEIIPQFRA